MSPRAKLRAALSQRLLPELARRGFVGPERLTGAGLVHEFRRARSGRLQLIRLQFHRWGRPRFVLNLQVEEFDPAGTTLQSRLPAAQARATQRPGAFTRSWFRADRPWWQRLLGNTSTLEDKAVTAALAQLGSIEDWFQNPRPMAPLRNVQVHRPLTPAPPASAE